MVHDGGVIRFRAWGLLDVSFYFGHPVSAMPGDKYPARPILVVDDERAVLAILRDTLQSAGYSHVVTCQDSREVLALAKAAPPELVLLDLNMPYLSGHDLIDSLGRQCPDAPIVVVTGAADIETAVRCMKAGSHDFLVKPFTPSRLLATVRNIVENNELQRENERLAQSLRVQQLQQPAAFQAIVTQDATMQRLFQYVEAISKTHKPVLITGETGTGKELMARAVHETSGRRGAFVAVNVSGLEDQLFSDTLFGHVRGAFTGADSDRRGLLRDADDGTIFLDEIGDLSPVSQAKLLRLLQDDEYHVLGQDHRCRSTARVVAATNRNLDEAQREGRFRNDLYYRLRVHHVELPPLRQRRGDVPLLLRHFVGEAALELGVSPPQISEDVVALLDAYPFPGNVRELASLVFEAISRNFDAPLLGEDVFLERLVGSTTAPARASLPLHTVRQLPTLKEASEQLVHEALRRAHGRQAAAAALLGISQPALCKRLQHLQGVST